ncbi:outer membrane protein TolC [Nonlabens dokdonensis]|jgi:outer membrane protein TolC|uniref:Outer membrane efflux protein n=3 Tax=Nonlabens dokdonensis TaxID=328515 RepID=L7W711_NONDD|nr:outer membrane efflux protein [Nonlabens dokdonensis DSW-6]PZX43658.1 outer membrane protein TolC [Nonlabens dokdonensis]
MKMSKLVYSLGVLMCLAFAKAYSQQPIESVLSKEDAVKLMLENNYGIKIAENTTKIAENNSGILNSGYLPSLQGTAGASKDENDSRTDFNGALDQNGDPRPDIEINDAQTTQYNAGLNLNYTLFDGLGRLYNYKRLQEQFALSQLEARSTIETTTVQLMSVYLEVARITENVKVFEQNLEISKKREERAQYQFEYGQANKLEVLNAQVDINTDSINIMNSLQQLRNTKRDLNLLLNRELNASFAVDTTVTLQSLLVIDSFLEKVPENNVRLLQSETSLQISDYDIKTTRALLLPRIGLTGSYGWNRTENPPSAFFPATTRTASNVAIGANLTWDIFDGGSSINNLRNAKIAYENEALFKSQMEQEVARDVANAKGNYMNALAIYRMQEQNVLTNKSNFERTQEQFKLGQVSSVEFRQAQVNLLNAETVKNLAKYDAKLAEYQLLQLAGQILNVAL